MMDRGGRMVLRSNARGTSAALVAMLLAGSALVPAWAGETALIPSSVQLTPPEGGCSYLTPQVSGNGAWVVAVSICASRPQGERTHQIIRIERTSGQVQVLTPPGVQSTAPTVSDDGRWVAFLSNADLVPGRNPHRFSQIFLFDAQTSRYVQVSRLGPSGRGPGTVGRPLLSRNGEAVVFSSDADLVAGRNQDRNLEIFLYEVGADRLIQVTDTEPPAYQHWPLVSDDATSVVFIGSRPPFAREVRPAIYRWVRRTRVVTEIVEAPFQDSGVFGDLTIAGRGERFAFSWKSDLLGENPDRNRELFAVEVTSGLIRQLTHSRGCTNGHPVLTADERRLLFVSNCPFGTLNPYWDANLFLMRLDTGEVAKLTETDAILPIEPPHMVPSGQVVVASLAAEIKGMTNPDHQLQIAVLTLPPLEPAGEVPMPPVLRAEDVTSLLVSAHDPAKLYLGTGKAGVLMSADGGRMWRLASFALGTEHITCLVEHPSQAGLVFAGTATTGVYKTTDDGILWMSLDSGLTDRRIRGLAVDPIYPEVLYADTPSGLFRSLDLGDHWHPLTGPPDRREPASPEGLRVSVPEGMGRAFPANTLMALPKPGERLLRATGAGLEILQGEDQWRPMAIPQAPEWVGADSKGAIRLVKTGAGLYRSTDSGGEWSPVLGLPPFPTVSVTGGPGEAWLALAHEQLYRSLDQGRTWEPVGSAPGLVRLIPAASPSATILAVNTGGALVLSRDGGVQWAPLLIPVPPPESLEAVLLRPQG